MGLVALRDLSAEPNISSKVVLGLQQDGAISTDLQTIDRIRDLLQDLPPTAYGMSPLESAHLKQNLEAYNQFTIFS
jgi:hypothetical protein